MLLLLQELKERGSNHEFGIVRVVTRTTCAAAAVCIWAIVEFARAPGETTGPGGSSGKALGYGLDGPGSIPGVGGVEIFFRSFVSRLVLGSTQPPIK